MEKKFGVVSADGHCRLMHLPSDLWTKRLPQRLQDDAPRVVRGPDGTRQWLVEGRPWSGVGWAGVGRGPVNCYTRAGLAEEPEPGIFRAANARYRCEDMDRDGVDAELVNGPYEQISMIKNPELRAACVRAVAPPACARSMIGRASCTRSRTAASSCCCRCHARVPKKRLPNCCGSPNLVCRVGSSLIGCSRPSRSYTRSGSRSGQPPAKPGCRSICTPTQAAGRARSGLGFRVWSRATSR